MNSDTSSSAQAATLTEVVLPGIVEPDGLIVRQRAVPAPGQSQAVVRTLATGVSFAEKSMRRDRYPGQPRFPFVLGYDLVGEVTEIGPGVDAELIGRRVAAVTKTGAWTTHALLDARDLVAIPETLDPAETETVVVNGITAWQMLHRKANIKGGQTILVHGANGGVGTTLVQLARHAGVRVIGTAAPRHHDRLRELGVEPIDYSDSDMAGRVREMAPHGVDAAFDHLGGPSFKRSFALLARGGTLVGYGTATQLEDSNNLMAMFVGILSRFTLWSLLPNGRRALFYNFWGGSRVSPSRFRARMASDLNEVLALLEAGVLTPQVAARVPLDQAPRAMALAESRSVYGKVVLVP